MSRATLLWVQRNTRKCDAWGCSVHTSCQFSRLPSAVNDLATTNQKIWAPPVSIPLPPWGTGRRRRMPHLVLMKRDWFRSLFSRFAVETVHNCDCFSEVLSEFHRCISAWCVQWDIPVFLLSLVLVRGWAIGMVFLCQFTNRCTSPRSSQFWVANHDILNFVRSDREFHQHSFCYISLEHCGPRNAVSVRQFCRAEHHEVAPFWWRGAGLKKHPVAICLNCGWIRFLIKRCPQVQ